MVLPNGVDWEVWGACVSNLPAEPPEFAKIPRPRVLLTGNLQSKLDFQSLTRLAHARPDIQIVLVGPAEQGVDLPEARVNLHWLGAKAYREMPAYYAHADAGVLPLLPTDYNRASCPLKLLEYLAAGLPVAASRIPATEYWAAKTNGAVCLYDSPEELGFALDAALSAGRKMTRAEISNTVRSATWTARAAALLEVLTNLSSANKS
jgi:glycosyltransferase involved in cell wall biosynthesis